MDCIAIMHTPFEQKFGIPRQPNLVAAEGRLEFLPSYNTATAVRGLEQASHVWVIWQFHACPHTPADKWQPLVRPPRLGGDQRLGVFATRSGFRPNRIGMSVCELLSIDPQGHLVLRGVDMLDGTPVLDVKPYLPYADAVPGAKLSWAEHEPETLRVIWAHDVDTSNISDQDRRLFEAVVAQDPRPVYGDTDKVFGCALKGINVRFSVTDGCATIIELQRLR